MHKPENGKKTTRSNFLAGHSKWANIKHRKDRADQQKGKIFSKLAKEIISAVKLGGPDPKSNSRLRIAIQQAKTANMPSENVERNIKKASSSEQADYIESTYEIYGYGGVGLVVETMTDNRNRLASDIRIAINKKGGSVATPGSVTFNFERKGVLQVKKRGLEEDHVFEAAIEVGAENFESTDEEYMITTDPALLFEVKEGLEARGIATEAASIEWIPKVFIECDEEAKTSNGALIAYLEDLDDVNAVYHNQQ
jgi:YebC/PmpR family DNA-binding regulatory protein